MGSGKHSLALLAMEFFPGAQETRIIGKLFLLFGFGAVRIHDSLSVSALIRAHRSTTRSCARASTSSAITLAISSIAAANGGVSSKRQPSGTLKGTGPTS